MKRTNFLLSITTIWLRGHENKFPNISTKIWKLLVGTRFSHYFRDCLLPHSSIWKTNYSMVIQIKFSFSSNKLQISISFGSRTILALKNLCKSRKFFLKSEWTSPCDSEARQTYIYRLRICCLVIGWNTFILSWSTLYTFSREKISR